ncbi:MAG: DJ-1/PfpI family protein [Thermosynechococcaceae cyanobacterium]
MSSPNTTTDKKQIAILLEDQFEDAMFQVPYTALRKAGANVTVLGSRMNEDYKGKHGTVSVKPDSTPTEVRAEDFDAIILPVGHIRTNPNVVHLVKLALKEGNLVAAIGYGPQVLIEAEQLQDKHVTGIRSIRRDLLNAGAIYNNKAVVIDDHLITARQTGDAPLFTAMILNHLGLKIKGTILPETLDLTYDCWKLGEDWGGSSKQELIQALNTAIMGERYTQEAFMQYSNRVSDPELRQFLQGVSSTKHYHVERLEARLFDAFKERVTWQAVGSEAYAALQGWLQSSDPISIMRRALGDIQTGVVDLHHLRSQLTDPQTVLLLEEVERDLANHEQRLAKLYRNRSEGKVKPPTPTTLAAVS